MAQIAADPRETAPPQAGPPAIARPDFDIVPRPGIAIGAVVFVLLIVAIASDKLWALEFFHVAFGAAWTIID
ncbi:MAG: hypothetical protein WAK93_19985, partial [Solirubrobacteraceae bacterium]